MPEHTPPDPIEQRLAALESTVEEIRDTLAHMARRERETPKPAATAGGLESPYSRVRKSLAGRAATPPGRPRDLEKWLGQNAMLVVGVLALVAAVGFTLKYAFDQGWISPAARVAAGLVAGAAIATYGETVIRRGLGRLGAGLQGAGAAIAYLSAWAAAGPYQFVPAGAGIAALAAISGLVLLTSLRSSEPYLAGLAAAGAYLAPLLLGEGPDTGNVLLAYGLLVSGGVGAVAVLRGWAAPLLIVIAGYFLMAFVATDAHAAFLGTYLTLGGGALLAAALEQSWRPHVVLAFVLAWYGVLNAQWVEGWEAWVLVAGPAALVWPLWRRALASPTQFRTRLGGAISWADGLAALFYLSAVLWTLVATLVLPAPADGYPLVAAALICLPFLLPALLRGQAAMHLAGIAVLFVGIVAQWAGLGIPVGLAALALFAGVTTRTGDLVENRWAGLALGAVASWALFENNAEQRPETDPALVGRWSVALYAVLGSLIAIAGPVWKSAGPRADAPGGFNLRVWSWLLVAVVALSGGTLEIPNFVLERGGSELAAGLAVSTYWLLVAGGLLAYGFWKDVRGVRLTGLAVAALAIGKVLFVDLAELQALYRVGSLALLAVIALLAARAYYRRE